MKTIAKILLAVTILTLSFQANAGKGKESSPNASNTITYKVLVHMEQNTPSILRDVFVLISDENGRIIGKPQRLTNGINEYNFEEAGPAKGTRIAHLGSALRPHSGTYLCKPDSKFGIFFGGNTYTFNLNILLPDLQSGIE